MSNFCYYKTKISVKGAFNPSWRFPVPRGPYGIWSPKAERIFSKDWLEYTAALGIDFNHALLFYRNSNMTSKEAHVDTHAITHEFVNSGFNWVIGGEGSMMHWYKLPNMNVASVVKDPRTNVPYTTFQFKDLTPIESTEIKNEITLVRTGIPHSISMGTDPRWCISARLKTEQDLSWNEIVELMRSKDLLEERQ